MLDLRHVNTDLTKRRFDAQGEIFNKDSEASKLINYIHVDANCNFYIDRVFFKIQHRNRI